jgi:prepilin-type N-terminal cleavage/methylation domain-containing protein
MSAQRGFSLIEMMVVVVVAGLVLAIGTPAFTNYRNTLVLRQAEQQITEDVRVARQLAITRRAPVYLRFGTGNGTTNLTTYTIHVDRNANHVVDAGDGLITRSMPGDSKLAVVALTPSDTLAFDISGILLPGTAGGTLIVRNARDRRDTLVVSAAGIAYRP